MIETIYSQNVHHIEYVQDDLHDGLNLFAIMFNTKTSNSLNSVNLNINITLTKPICRLLAAERKLEGKWS